MASWRSKGDFDSNSDRRDFVPRNNNFSGRGRGRVFQERPTERPETFPQQHYRQNFNQNFDRNAEPRIVQVQQQQPRANFHPNFVHNAETRMYQQQQQQRPNFNPNFNPNQGRSDFASRPPPGFNSRANPDEIEPRMGPKNNAGMAPPPGFHSRPNLDEMRPKNDFQPGNSFKNKEKQNLPQRQEKSNQNAPWKDKNAPWKDQNAPRKDQNAPRKEQLQKVTPAMGTTALGRCVRCRKPGEYSCERCMDPYCSQECQRADWPVHKNSCNPIPRLVKTNAAPKQTPSIPVPNEVKPDSSKPVQKPTRNVGPIHVARGQTVREAPNRNQAPKIQKNRPTIPIEPPKSGSTVLLTAIISPNIVCIRSCEPRANKAYVDLLDEVNQLGQKAEPLPKMPAEGSIVAAEHQGDFFRALVLAAKSVDHILVSLLELGSVASKKLSDLRPLWGNFRDAPNLVRKFGLKDVPTGDNSAARQYLRRLEEEFVELEVIFSGTWQQRTTGELVVKRTHESVNERLREIVAGGDQNLICEESQNEGAVEMEEFLKECNKFI